LDLLILVELLKPRSRTLEDLVKQAVPYFLSEVEYEEKAVKKIWIKDLEQVIERIEKVREALEDCPWAEEALERRLRGLAEEMGIGAGKVFQPLRLALTGSSASPGIFDVLLLLGRGRSLTRIDRALAFLKAGTYDGGA
jgi:glutamyl-tRNA synthetase